MRTSHYGIDLREKVISFIESGNAKSVASRHIRWLLLKRANLTQITIANPLYSLHRILK